MFERADKLKILASFLERTGKTYEAENSVLSPLGKKMRVQADGLAIVASEIYQDNLNIFRAQVVYEFPGITMVFKDEWPDELLTCTLSSGEIYVYGDDIPRVDS